MTYSKTEYSVLTIYGLGSTEDSDRRRFQICELVIRFMVSSLMSSGSELVLVPIEDSISFRLVRQESSLR